MGETLPYLAPCETLPLEAHSFEDVLTYKKQETTAVLIILWESHVMDLPTGFVRTWALDIANSCWIPSKRTDWEMWATVLANCQILKLSCFYAPCHVVIFSSLSSIIFPNFPCFLIFLKVVFSPHLGLTPKLFSRAQPNVMAFACINFTTMLAWYTRSLGCEMYMPQSKETKCNTIHQNIMQCNVYIHSRIIW